jgi:very-short-patch-repair endonuclease
MFNYNKKSLFGFRKKLRNHLTPAEAALWDLIKQRKLEGRKFRRQHSVGNYILDFYCPDEKLAIELDGEGHYWEDGIQKDKRKTAFMVSHGIEIIRFENLLVFQDTEFVLKSIVNKFKNTTPHPPTADKLSSAEADASEPLLF